MRRATVLIAENKSSLAVSNPSMAVEIVTRVPRLHELLATRKPSIAVVALDLPGLGGAEGVRYLQQLSPTTKIIVVARNADESEELEVLRSGARGYVTHSLSRRMLEKSIQKVQEGEIWARRRAIGALISELVVVPCDSPSIAIKKRLDALTKRELDIVDRLAAGATNKEIASALNVSVATVKAHLTSIFRKLGQPDRLRLALYLNQGLHDSV